MIESQAHDSKATKDPAALLTELGFSVRSFRPIQWKRVQATPLYLIDTDEGKFVLKWRTPPTGLSSRLRRWLGNPELSTQAHVYSSLMSQQFRHLRFPRLIDTDSRSYLLLEFVPAKANEEEEELPQQLLLDSLLEFQLAEMRLSNLPLQQLLAAKSTPFARLLRRLLTGIRSKLGWKLAQLGVEKAFQARRSQPPIGRYIVCHNDFHRSNLLLDDSGTIYFTDFETVTLDDRWVLSDVVHLAVGTYQFDIDTGIVADYFDLLARRSDLTKLDFVAQVRFALLLRVSRHVLSSVPPPAVVSQYTAFFQDVLLDDDEFAHWLRANFDSRLLKTN